VNAFSAVSLDPPLVSCCVQNSSETWPRVIGDSVQPGATAFTRASGFLLTTSFLRLSRRPPRIADFAAA
jgi:hypothetical protein